MPNLKKPTPMSLTVSIIDRGSGNKLVKLYEAHQVFIHLRCEGTGTATSEILDILGLGSSEKDIVLSVAPIATARALLAQLDDTLRGAVPGRGIAFTLPMNAISSIMASYIDFKTKPENGGTGPMEQQQKHSLILIAVNQGFTDAVMATARKAGARGGTIIRGRWAGDQEFETAYGIARSNEKELLFIVAPADKRNAIMDAVNREHGLRTEAASAVCALPIDQLVHLG